MPYPNKVATTLYLVDPAGGRYPITTFPPAGDSAGLELVDWSGDGTRALFAPYGSDLQEPAPVVVVVDCTPATRLRCPSMVPSASLGRMEKPCWPPTGRVTAHRRSNGSTWPASINSPIHRQTG